MTYKVVEKDVEERVGFLHDEEFVNEDEAEEFINKKKEELGDDYYEFMVVEIPISNYKKGFDILMEYWESLPDEEKPKINKELEKVGL